MKFIGFDREEEAIEWAKAKIGVQGPTGLARAISAVDSKGGLSFVVVLSNFAPRNVDLHIAAVAGSRWAAPKEFSRMFNFVFHYVFEHLGAARVTGLIRATNVECRRYAEHFGFSLEGVMRKAFSDCDLCIYGFLKEDFLSHKLYGGKLCTH